MRKVARLAGFDSTVFQEVFRKMQTMKNPINLSIGFPEGDTPRYIKDAGIQAIQDGHTAYVPSNGIPELRAAVSEKLKQNNIAAPPDDIVIVPGLSTGFLLVYLSTLDPGDEVIIMDPSFPPYVGLAKVVSAEVKSVPVRTDFQLDLKAIKANISPKTRLIVINTPNNPTGAVYEKEDLIKLAELAEEYGITIVSDEMYESFLYAGEHFSIGSIYPNTLTLNGFSKSHSMTGWRLGYISGPAEIMNAIRELIQYAVFSSSSIAQYAALKALERPTPSRSPYLKKRQIILDKLTSAGYTIHGSDGAYYTYFQAPSGMSDIEFADRAAKHNLIVVPGRAFSQDETFIRLSYGGNIKDIQKGLEIITKITKQARQTI